MTVKELKQLLERERNEKLEAEIRIALRQLEAGRFNPDTAMIVVRKRLLDRGLAKAHFGAQGSVYEITEEGKKVLHENETRSR